MTQAQAPIALFAYRRPKRTASLLQSLSANPLASDSELFIFSDGAKDERDRAEVAAVRKLAASLDGFRRVTLVERPRNLGLATNVISGIRAVMLKYDRVIAVEDDLLLSPHFLSFMNRALEAYQDQPRIFSITGFGYPPQLLTVPEDYCHAVYLSHRGGSCGWATWRDRWNSVDWHVGDYASFRRDRQAQRAFNRGGEDLTAMLAAQMNGQIDSWAIRWAYARFRQGRYAVVPVFSYVNNTGNDNSGTHGKSGYLKFPNDLNRALPKPELPQDLVPCEPILAGIRRIFRPSLRVRLRQVLRRL